MLGSSEGREMRWESGMDASGVAGADKDPAGAVEPATGALILTNSLEINNSFLDDFRQVY